MIGASALYLGVEGSGGAVDAEPIRKESSCRCRVRCIHWRQRLRPVQLVAQLAGRGLRRYLQMPD